MKNKNFSLFAILALAALLLMAPAPVAAQTATTSTTISAAMTATQNTITLTSATGVVAMTGTGPTTGAFVDKEFIRFRELVSGTTYKIDRGVGTKPTAHASSAKAYIGTISGGPFFLSATAAEPAGACTATSEQYLPRIYTQTGSIFDCRSNGQWIKIANGTMSLVGQRIGAFCTGSVGAGETEYLNDVACSGATAATAGFVVTGPGTLANLYLSAGTAVSGGSSKDVATVYKNGSATTLTCTFATGGAATTCSDLTHSVAVVAGDLITFQFVTMTSTDTGANLKAAVSLF